MLVFLGNRTSEAESEAPSKKVHYGCPLLHLQTIWLVNSNLLSISSLFLEQFSNYRWMGQSSTITNIWSLMKKDPATHVIRVPETGLLLAEHEWDTVYQNLWSNARIYNSVTHTYTVVLRVIRPFSLIGRYHCFGGTHCPHLQCGSKWSWESGSLHRITGKQNNSWMVRQVCKHPPKDGS